MYFAEAKCEKLLVLPLKVPNKNAADNTFFFLTFDFYRLKKMRLDVSPESSA